MLIVLLGVICLFYLESQSELEAAYAFALQDAKVAEPSEICNSLTAITSNNPILTWKNNRVKMVTWTSSEIYDHRIGSEITLKYQVWLTATPQLQDFCRANNNPEGKSLTLRLEQLLGLRMNSGKNRFVEMWVRPEDMLRPSPDGEIDDTVSELEIPSSDHFASIEKYEFYRDWFNAELSLQAYDDASKGYPWTRLGYTYDWGNPNSEIGLSEFVVIAGASVEIDQVYSITEYCYSHTTTR